MPTGHRVYAKTARRTPPPRFVLPAPHHEDREYVDRFGIHYIVVWNDRPRDPSLSSYDTVTEAST